jgi:hypothetical protein
MSRLFSLFTRNTNNASTATRKVECGDIILVRQYDDTAYGLTHPGLLRGMVSHIKGHFDTELQVNLDAWTSVGIIYRVRADRDARHLVNFHKNVKKSQVGLVNVRNGNAGENKRQNNRDDIILNDKKIDAHHEVYEPYVIIVDHLGVQLWTYSAFLRNAEEKHYIVACRHLHVNKNYEVSYVEIDELYKRLLPVGVSWISMRGMKYPHNTIKIAVRNAALRSKRMPESMQRELKRYFLSLDDDNNGYIDRHEVKKLLQRLHGGDISDARVKLLMNAIDINHDGVITFDEFVIGFAKKPFKSIAAEHDFCGDTSAELVAGIYESMGLLTKRMLLEKEYKPVHFSSPDRILLLHHAHLQKEIYIKNSRKHKTSTDGGNDDSSKKDEDDTDLDDLIL